MSQDICLLSPPILTDTICCHSSATAVLQTNKQTGLLKSETEPFAVSWAAFTRDQCGLVPFGLDPIWYEGGGGRLNCVGFTWAKYHPGTVQFQTGALS